MFGSNDCGVSALANAESLMGGTSLKESDGFAQFREEIRGLILSEHTSGKTNEREDNISQKTVENLLKLRKQVKLEKNRKKVYTVDLVLID